MESFQELVVVSTLFIILTNSDFDLFSTLCGLAFFDKYMNVRFRLLEDEIYFNKHFDKPQNGQKF